ncbi:MAG: ATP synthase F1 subunit delta [Elusimicrobia bacterium RIFOXYB2_FULL_49_7]|nr:MAG: ATP synthase F1 subunit delta [Elusimicrobia bacterium RIFOXYB2_FULL_49_7]
MSDTRVARRYTKALFALAEERGELKTLLSDMTRIGKTFAASKELTLSLRNPVLPPSVKYKVLNRLFEGKISALTATFVAFLEKKRRLEILPEVSCQFLEMDKERRGLLGGILYSARPLPAERVKAFAEGLNRRFKKTFEIVTVEKRELIGGFRLMIQDRIFDCSVQNQLKELEKRLIGTN